MFRLENERFTLNKHTKFSSLSYIGALYIQRKIFTADLSQEQRRTLNSDIYDCELWQLPQLSSRDLRCICEAELSERQAVINGILDVITTYDDLKYLWLEWYDFFENPFDYEYDGTERSQRIRNRIKASLESLASSKRPKVGQVTRIKKSQPEKSCYEKMLEEASFEEEVCFDEDFEEIEIEEE